MLRLQSKTPDGWLTAVLADFDRFLLDHASCERKASALAMSLVAHYPDRPELVTAMIDLALEELEHFRATYSHLAARGLTLGPDEKDVYVRSLLAQTRQGRDEYFLDRLLVAGIVEARGCERFGLIADALPAGSLKDFYTDITRSEARHHGLFVRLARTYFSDHDINARLDALLTYEAELIQNLPLRATLH